jgi:hypothetical protein
MANYFLMSGLKVEYYSYSKIDKLDERYKEYKTHRPDFDRVVEKEEAKLNGNYRRKED